jgi:hypothetical protein
MEQFCQGTLCSNVDLSSLSFNVYGTRDPDAGLLNPIQHPTRDPGAGLQY